MNAIRVSIEPNTPEWLAWRKGKIGASDAAAIMGIDPWCTPYQKWLEKMDLQEREQTYAMAQGKIKEKGARKRLSEMFGVELKEAVFEHESLPLIASIDAVDDRLEYVYEIKHPNAIAHELALDKIVPEYYYPQLQHQMYVLDLESITYVSINETFKDDIAFVVQQRDEAFIDQLVKKELAFYDCIINFTAPELTERDYVNRSDSEWEFRADQLLQVQNNIKELKEREEKLKIELINLADGKPSQGAGVRLSKVVRKGNIDYATLVTKLNIDIEPYRKEPISYWKIGGM